MTPEERARKVARLIQVIHEDDPKNVARTRAAHDALIIAEILAAVAEEREACAKTVETLAYASAAAAIRARP